MAGASTEARPADGSPTGSQSENVLPCPSVLFTEIRPPWFSSATRQKASPSPLENTRGEDGALMWLHDAMFATGN